MYILIFVPPFGYFIIVYLIALSTYIKFYDTSKWAENSLRGAHTMPYICSTRLSKKGGWRNEDEEDEDDVLMIYLQMKKNIHLSTRSSKSRKIKYFQWISQISFCHLPSLPPFRSDFHLFHSQFFISNSLLSTHKSPQPPPSHRGNPLSYINKQFKHLKVLNKTMDIENGFHVI